MVAFEPMVEVTTAATEEELGSGAAIIAGTISLQSFCVQQSAIQRLNCAPVAFRPCSQAVMLLQSPCQV